MDIGGQSLRPSDRRGLQSRSGADEPGGVGRNIAHNMALLGLDVRLLTAFGDDLYAQRIAASCGELGIDISQALQVPGGSTSTYLYLNGPDGDMALAVSDMDICQKLTPQFLSSRLTLLNNAQLIVADANLPAGIPPLPGGKLHPRPFCRPGVYGQGGELAAHFGENPHPEAQPHRGRASVRRGHCGRREPAPGGSGAVGHGLAPGVHLPGEPGSLCRQPRGELCCCLAVRRSRSMPPAQGMPLWQALPGPTWRGRI